MRYDSKYIYIITNTVNGKVYIGQSVNPESRFKDHIWRSSHKTNPDYDKVLYKAFRKYGVENFTFEIIGSYENYNEKEVELIQLYRATDIRHGYNVGLGGENPPIGCGGNLKYEDEKVCNILNSLIHTDLSLQEIANIHGVSYNYIRELNNGSRRPVDGIKYPIRDVVTFSEREEQALRIIEDLLHSNLTQKEIAQKYGVARSCVTMINIGQNHKQDYINYPIRKGRVAK